MQDDVTEHALTPGNPPAEQHIESPSVLPGLLGAGGMLLLVVIMLGKLRKRRRSMPLDADLTAREQIQAVRLNANRNREPLERLMAEAEELTRHLAAVLDNKAAKLELLIEEADRKLGQFQPGQAPPPPPAEDRPLPRVQTRPAAKVGRIDPSLLDRARVAQAEAERTSNELRATDPAAAALRRATSSPPSPHDHIYRLADEGLSPLEIARRTGEPVGQVELVLNLRR